MAEDIAVLGIEVRTDGVRKGSDDLDKLTHAGAKADGSAKTLTNSIKTLGSALAGLAVGSSIKEIALGLIDAQQAADKLKNSLQYSIGSASGVAKELDYLRSVTRSMGVDFRTASEAYAKFSAAVKGSGISAQQTKTIFEGVAGAATKMGLSAEETQGAFLALSQMASKGVVSAEELRGQLAERLPGALGIAAKAMGVTEREFGKMLETGQVMASDFLPKFGRALKENFEAPLSSITQEINRLNSAWDGWKQELANADGGSFKFLTNGLNESAAAMRELGKEAGIVQRLLVAIGGFQAGAVGAGKFDTQKLQQDAMGQLGKVVQWRRTMEGRSLNYLEQEQLRDLIGQEQSLRSTLLQLAERRGKESFVLPDIKGEYLAQSAKRKEAFNAYMSDVQSEKDKQVAKENERWKSVTAVIGTSGADYEKALSAHNAKLADINKKPAGSGGYKNDAAEEMRARLEVITSSLNEEVEAIKLSVATGEKTQLEGIDAVRAAQQSAHAARIQELNVALARETDSGKRAILTAKVNDEVKTSVKEATTAEINRLNVEKAYQKLVDDRMVKVAEETDSLFKKAQAAEEELATIGLTADQLAILTARRYDEKIAILQAEAERLRSIDLYSAEAYAIEGQIEALQRLKNVEVTRPKLQAQAREWEKFSDDINRALTDALMRGFESGKSFGQNFVDSLKNSLKTSALKIVVNYVTDGAGQLVGSLANAGINYVAGTSGANGGAGNSYLGYANTASTAYSAYNMATTAIPAMYAQYQAGVPIAQWMTANYAPVVDASASIAAAAAAQAEAAANLTAAASQAAAEGNVALAAWLEAEAAATATTTTSSAAVGSSASSALTGIGLIISGMLMAGDAWKEGYKPNGDLHDTGDIKTSPLVLRDWEYKIQKALFGEKWAGSKTLAMLTGSSLQIKTVDKWWGGRETAGKPELQGTFSTDGAGFDDGRVGQQITKHGGTFTRDKQWWVWQDATNQLDAALDSIFVSVSTSLLSVGKALGDESLVEKIKGFSLDISQELNEKTLLSLAGQLTEAMGSILYPSIDSLRKSATVEGKQVAETWDQTFSRVMVEASAVSRVFDMMGMTMAGAFGNDNADKILKLSDAFVQVFGSVDALNASFNSYYENFYSQEEKTAQAWKDMTNAFGQLNQTLPTTREGFRALVDSAAKAGDAGLYKSLLDLQGSFANLVPVIDTQTAAQEALAAAQAQAAEQAKLAAEAAIEAARLSAEAFMRVADEAREAAFGRADSGMATLERAIDLEKQRATAARDAASEQINGIKGLFGLLDDQIAGLVGTTEQALAAQSAAGLSFIEQAAVSARAGYLPDQSQLTNAIGQARAGISGTQYASSFDREFAALKLAGSLSQIREAGAKQLPVAERALSTAESQLKTLDDTLTNTRRQVDELKGISANTATLGSSIDEMSAAIVGELRTQLSALNSAVLSGLNSGTLSASEASSRLKAGGVETDKFTTIAGQPAFVSSQGAVATASGIATTNGWRGSIDDARKIVAETFASSQPKDFYTAAIQVGLSAAMIDAMYSLPAGTANEWARANNLPAFAQGTNRVPQDMLALIHKDEAIIPAAYNPAAGGSMPTSRLEALVESLTAEVKRLQGQVSEVGNNTRRTADAVNGNPEAPMLVESVV